MFVKLVMRERIYNFFHFGRRVVIETKIKRTKERKKMGETRIAF